MKTAGSSTAITAALALCLACAPGFADNQPDANTDGADAKTEPVFDAVRKVLRGETVSRDDLEKIDGAVIRLERAGSDGGVGIDRGVEGGPEGLGPGRNIYIIRIDAGTGNERHLQVLRLQREILRNQLFLLKSLTPIARHQAALGTRMARVENGVRDVTMGMRSSRRDMRHLRGEAGSTSAKVTDINRTTVVMADTLKEIEKGIDDLSGTLADVDMMIGDMAEDVGSGKSRYREK